MIVSQHTQHHGPETGTPKQSDESVLTCTAEFFVGFTGSLDHSLEHIISMTEYTSR